MIQGGLPKFPVAIECYMLKFDPMFTTFLQDKIFKILSVKVYTLKHLDSQSSSIGAALCRYEVCRHLLMRGGTHTVLHYARGTQTRGTLCLTVSVQKENCPQCKLVALNVASISRVSTFCIETIEQRRQKVHFKCSICLLQ